MQYGAQAYGKVAKQTSSPRELEASLLLKAAARLQAVRDAWGADRSQVDEALHYNRKLWSFFLVSVTQPDNPLPDLVRQNMANLGMFVMNQTLSLMAEPQREKLVPLISINREIAAGLLGRAGALPARKPRRTSSDIIDDAQLVEHRGRLQRSLQARLQRQDLRRDLLLRCLFDAVQHTLQHSLTLLLARLRVVHGGLRKRELGLDVLYLLFPVLRA